MNLLELEERLAQWHARKYPKGIDLERTAIKVMEEVGELARGLLRGDTVNILEEVADVAITLVHLARGLGGSLAAEMLAKTAVIEQRLVERGR